MPSDPLVIDRVSHSYGKVKALSDVSLSVEAGSFTVLLGINGAGKTTLLNLITRLFATRDGSINVCGADLNLAPSQALARMGVVFQSRSLDANLTVAQNMIYQGALQGIPRRETLSRAEIFLTQLGLAERMGDKAGRLSGGQQRRVEIARALLHRPRLILCDEATVGLDVRSRSDIVADLHRMAAAEGLGVLWTTHLIDEVSPQDPVYVLHKGGVLAKGLAHEIAGEGTLSDAFLTLTGAEAAA
ncbi:MAG: ATP-binding cassette domain-containing protein [Pseudomonadota bacterium]